MVDPRKQSSEEKIKNFMGKTPALLKSKLLSVWDSSNDLLHGIKVSLQYG